MEISGLYIGNNLFKDWQNLLNEGLIEVALDKNKKLAITSVSPLYNGYLVIDSSIYSIESSAFLNANLSRVYIPSTLKVVGFNAFKGVNSIVLDFENKYGWSYLNYEVVGTEERFHDYTRPSMGKEIVNVYDFVLKEIEFLSSDEIENLIIKDGKKCVNNEDYLSVFYKTILSDNVVENYYSALKNVAYSKWLSKVLPEILYASLQPQNTPWHVYNVLDHILHTVKHVNALSKDLNYNARKMLALSAFFHDLGKPDCATKKEVDGTVYDTFKGHARRSVEIFNKSFKHFNLDAREWELITFLIKNHDFLMDLKIYNVDKIDKNVVKKELFKDFNYDESEKDAYFLLLITLTLADNMAQNLDLTHKNVELLGALLKEIKI